MVIASQIAALYNLKVDITKTVISPTAYFLSSLIHAASDWWTGEGSQAKSANHLLRTFFGSIGDSYLIGNSTQNKHHMLIYKIKTRDAALSKKERENLHEKIHSEIDEFDATIYHIKVWNIN
jgi:hypothetical protein